MPRFFGNSFYEIAITHSQGLCPSTFAIQLSSLNRLLNS